MKIRIIVIIFCSILIAFLAAGSVAVHFFLYVPAADAGSSEEIRVKISEGASARSVSRELKELGLIRSSNVFYYYVRLNHIVLKSGTYKVPSSIAVPQLAELLSSGRQEYITVVIPEGLTLKKIASLLEAEKIVPEELFIDTASDPALLAEYGIPALSFEGYLFPDTYFLEEGMEPERIIRMMADNFFKKIKKIQGSEILDPERLHKAVILASIVEREYRVADEAPLIASVFKNRIAENIGLYSCATVEYIITEINGLPHPNIITYDDLKDPSPYNTYKWKGLPPGPISNPGAVALDAAINAPQTEYYFFRLIDPETGRHHFSVSFNEHTEMGRVLYTKKAAGR